MASVGLPSRLEGRRGSSSDMTAMGTHAANAMSPSKGSGLAVSTILTESESACLSSLFFMLSPHASVPYPHFFAPSSSSLHTQVVKLSVVKSERSSSLALDYHINANVKRQAFHLEMAEDYLSYTHRALNNSVQALRTGTVTVCGP